LLTGILGYTWYQLAWYFVMYSFIGWCLEVVYCTAESGKIVNRGFLNGPVCPIYGFGMLVVLFVLKLVPQGTGSIPVWALFLGGMVLASAVELIGGWLMLRIFHARWWDYSDKPFNVGGFICLEFSLLWGLGAVVVVRGVQPALAHVANHKIPADIGWPILAVLYAVYFVDLVLTCVTVAGLNRDLKELDAVSAKLRTVSDALSVGLGTGALTADQKLDEGKLQVTLATAEAKDAVTDAAAQARDAVTEAAAQAKRSALEAASQAKRSALETAGQAKRSALETAGQAKRSALETAGQAKRSALETAGQAKRSALETRASLEARAAALRADVLHKTHFGGGRLLRAFPHMAHAQYRSIVEDLKVRLDRRE
jgi:uncharacterized membrane protein